MTQHQKGKTGEMMFEPAWEEENIKKLIDIL